jgi:hypothetical protein
MCPTQADNNSRKLRFRCDCQFPWCAVDLKDMMTSRTYTEFYHQTSKGVNAKLKTANSFNQFSPLDYYRSHLLRRFQPLLHTTRSLIHSVSHLLWYHIVYILLFFTDNINKFTVLQLHLVISSVCILMSETDGGTDTIKRMCASELRK